MPENAINIYERARDTINSNNLFVNRNDRERYLRHLYTTQYELEQVIDDRACEQLTLSEAATTTVMIGLVGWMSGLASPLVLPTEALVEYCMLSFYVPSITLSITDSICDGDATSNHLIRAKRTVRQRIQRHENMLHASYRPPARPGQTRQLRTKIILTRDNLRAFKEYIQNNPDHTLDEIAYFMEEGRRHLRCPLSSQIAADPVWADDGKLYSKAALNNAYQLKRTAGQTCELPSGDTQYTNPEQLQQYAPAVEIYEMIQELEAQRDNLENSIAPIQ